MRNWPERHRRRARIEIIPMIDVMMFLLVFFVLISTNVLPALGLHVALPKSADPEHVQEIRRATLTLTKDGRLFLDASEVAIADLPARLEAMKTPDTHLAVIIAGDEGVDLQRLVNVLDALKLAHIDAASIIAKHA